MAQDVALWGVAYTDVPEVRVPKQGGGMAAFHDVSDTTAQAADVAQGKLFHAADGTLTEGTASGGGGDDYHPAAKDDGKTYFYIEIPSDKLRTVPLTLSHVGSGLTKIDWGDGAVTTASDVAGHTHNHTYSERGRYVITVYVTSGYTQYGNGTTSTTVFGTGTVSSAPSYTSLLPYAIEIGSTGIANSSISDYAFQYCTNIRKVVLCDGVSQVGRSSFSNCTLLDDLSISSTLQTVGSYAFMNTRVQSLTFPKALATIGDPFSNMYCLEEAAFLSEPTITGRILSGCKILESFVVPKSVTQIGAYGFIGIDSMRELHFQTATPPTLVSNSFYNIPSDCIIFVPQGSLNAYKTAQYWSALASQIQEEPA